MWSRLVHRLYLVVVKRFWRSLVLTRDMFTAWWWCIEIVPRAFSCNYPDFVALILKLLNGSFHARLLVSTKTSLDFHVPICIACVTYMDVRKYLDVSLLTYMQVLGIISILPVQRWHGKSGFRITFRSTPSSHGLMSDIVWKLEIGWDNGGLTYLLPVSFVPIALNLGKTSSFSSSVWQHFINRVNLHPPQSFEAILECLARPSTDQHITLICRLFYQASMYSIWKERNARLHSSVARPPDVIISDIEDTIKLKLDPLSRTNRYITSSHVTALLGTWLSLF